jgi:hypothetical protein
MRPRNEAVPRVVPRANVRHVLFWKVRPSVQGAAFSWDAEGGTWVASLEAAGIEDAAGDRAECGWIMEASSTRPVTAPRMGDAGRTDGDGFTTWRIEATHPQVSNPSLLAAEKATQRALRVVTQRALSVTQRALSVTQQSS